MPEPREVTLPPVLMRRLSAWEQNVLRVSAGADGVFAVYRAMGLRSEEEARERIAEVKAKAARILADAGAGTNGHGPTPAKCGCGTEFTPRTGDGGKCSACRAGAPPRAPRPRPGGDSKPALPPIQPPQHARSGTRRAKKAQQRETTVEELRRRERDEEWPHTKGGAVRRQLTPNAESQREEAATKKKHEGLPRPGPIVPGRALPEEAKVEGPEKPFKGANEERRERALALLRERGPMRQADLAKALRIAPELMSPLKRLMANDIVEGEKVRLSPVLRLRSATENDESATEPVSMEPSSADELADDPPERSGEISGEIPADIPDDSPERVHESDHMDASVDTSADDSAQMGASVGGLDDEPERVDAGKLREPTPEEEAQSAAALLIRKLHEVERLAGDIDGAVPPVLLKARYLAALLAKIEAGDTSPDLLDRFERLAGIES